MDVMSHDGNHLIYDTKVEFPSTDPDLIGIEVESQSATYICYVDVFL